MQTTNAKSVEDIRQASRWLEAKHEALAELERLARKGIITAKRLEMAEQMAEIAGSTGGYSHELDAVERTLGFVPEFSVLADELLKKIRRTKTKEEQIQRQIKETK